MPQTPIRVLLIDDDEVMQMQLRRILKRLGPHLSMRWLSDSSNALDEMQAGQFDVCLLDYNIDHRDGLELLSDYRAAGGDLPVIILTGDDRPEIDERALEAGANDYLLKDEFSDKSLSRAMRYAVQNTELLRQLRQANKRFQADLEAAATVQSALLPQDAPSISGYPITWRYQPSANVAGDFLNYFKLDDQHFAVLMIDVSGHGVPAAMFAVQLSRILEPGLNYGTKTTSIRASDYFNPVELLRRLNLLFPMKKPDLKYFTITYAVVDQISGRVSFASAGGTRPIIISANGQTKELECSGMPIGMMPDTTYDLYSYKLQTGDRMLFYSDGLTDAVTFDQRLFGKERMLEALQHPTSHIEEQADYLMKAVTEWMDERQEQDDCSLLMFARERF
jgi:sigma-B regulation protein RsbU (phosphoserine phosphatase)